MHAGNPRLMPPPSGTPLGGGDGGDGGMASAAHSSMKGQHADIVTIAIVPAGVMPAQPPTLPQRPGQVTPSVQQPPGAWMVWVWVCVCV